MIRAFLVILLALTTPALGCGVERWPVKVGLDRDTSSVVLKPERIGIKALTELPAPHNPDAYRDKRFPAELQTYTIRGRMTLIKHEADGDYHIVVTAKSGAHMIVESPDPKCAKGSRFLRQIIKVRHKINGRLGKTGRRKRHPNIRVAVTGIAFFDKIHGQEGVAPNGIELHPILGIKFK